MGLCRWVLLVAVLLRWLRQRVSLTTVHPEGRPLTFDIRCGMFQLYYSEVMFKDHSSSALAWITTLQIFMLFMFGPAVGKMIDVYGCRKTLLPFSIMAVFSVCMLSLCTKYWQVMLAQGVAFGLAAAGLSLPAMATATQWFSTKKGLAVGIVSAGSSLGKTKK